MKKITKKELKEIEKEAEKILLKDKKCEHKNLYVISDDIIACSDCAKEFAEPQFIRQTQRKDFGELIKKEKKNTDWSKKKDCYGAAAFEDGFNQAINQVLDILCLKL